MIAGVTLPAGGSAFDRNGPSKLRALAHSVGRPEGSDYQVKLLNSVLGACHGEAFPLKILQIGRLKRLSRRHDSVCKVGSAASVVCGRGGRL